MSDGTEPDDELEGAETPSPRSSTPAPRLASDMEFDGRPYDATRVDPDRQRRQAGIVVAVVVLVAIILVSVFGITRIFGPHGSQTAYAVPSASPGGPVPAGTYGDSPYAPVEAKVTSAPAQPDNPYAVPTATADPLVVRQQAEEQQREQQVQLQEQAARQAQAQQLAEQQDAIARQSQSNAAGVPAVAPVENNPTSSQRAQSGAPASVGPGSQQGGTTSGEFDVGGSAIGQSAPGSTGAVGSDGSSGSAYAARNYGGAPVLPSSGTVPGPGAASGEAAHANRQLAFISNQGQSNGVGYVAPASHYLINPTTAITARLISDVNSDLPGPVEAEVTQRVYTSIGHRIVVIPEGTRVFGSYDSALISGQNRLLMAWTELDFANGCSFHMGAQPATDAEGRSGASGHVDNHSLQLFRSAFLVTVLGVAEGLLVPQNSSVLSQQTITQQVGQAAGAQLSQLGNRLIDRSLDRQPTITIDTPYEFQIMVTKPLPLDEYQTAGDRCFQSQS